ncbi:MAG TPA: efflux RND transporter periplasmic adaptor subunit [Vicinamibacteria bacterium]|nr:efflux RND transporter periplasmic adaptor subunit [Vicinamibacteria bacterium]
MAANLDDLKIDRSERNERRSMAWLVWAILATVALAGIGALWSRPSGKIVSTATARVSEAQGEQTVLNASGYVTARRRATVSSKVTAKVLEVLIEEGMEVREGQILARLDSSNTEASLNLAAAELRAARTALEETRVQLEEAALQLERTKALVRDAVLSQAELDRVQATTDSLQARLERQREEVEVAERRVAVWEQQLEDTVIRAPFDGIVTTKDAQPGEMISPVSAGGGFTRTGIGTVVDMSSLEIEVDVNESYINRVRPGQSVEATLDAYPQWKIPTKVLAIVPTADRDRATVRVRIGFDELDPRILPEMGVKVAFRDEQPARDSGRVISIPQVAVRNDGGRDVVFVVNGERVERRAITVASGEGDETVVLSGLEAGERVVVEGPEDLADGDAVKERPR